VLHIHAHRLEGCPVPADAALQLHALGDFDVSNRTVEIVHTSTQERELPLPFSTRAVALRASGGSARFHGLGERTGERVDVLLWPELSDCELYRPAETPAYPAPRGRQAMGVSHSQQTLLVAGGVGDSSASALSLDLETGIATRIEGDGGLLERHEYATISEFGDALLVAGGYDVVEERNAAAEVFEPGPARFTSTPITLRNPRRRHTAVVLKTGETLLVGGLNANGRPLLSLELVSPSRRAAETVVPLLKTPRVEPSVARLDDGGVLVASGMNDVDTPGGLTTTPLGIERIDADLAAVQVEEALPARFNRALLALPGGSALAVGGCEDRAPAPGESCSARCGTLPEELADSRAGRARGCPPAGFDAWWIPASGTATQLPDLPAGVDASRPVLIAASDSAPWLLAAGQVLRFEPWTGRFVRVDVPESLRLPEDAPAPLAIDAGAFVWLTEVTGAPSGRSEVSLRGFRHGTRGSFESDTPLLLGRLPLHLSPNQAPVHLNGGEADVRFDGELHLLGAEAAVFVTDTVYRDVEIEIELSAGPPPTLIIGSTSIEWTKARAGAQTLVARRRGDVVELRHGEGSERTRHALGTARLRVGLAGQDASETSIVRIEIRRSF